MKTLLLRFVLRILALTSLSFGVAALAAGQDEVQSNTSAAAVGAAVGQDGTGRIRLEVQGELPEPPLFYTADIHDRVEITPTRVLHRAELRVRLLQGESPIVVRLGIRGAAEVTAVEGEALAAWSVGQEGGRRFLDIRMREGAAGIQAGIQRFVVAMRSEEFELPVAREITHFAPTDEMAGFEQRLTLHYASGVEGRVTAAEGFLPLARSSARTGPVVAGVVTAGPAEVVEGASRDGPTAAKAPTQDLASRPAHRGQTNLLPADRPTEIPIPPPHIEQRWPEEGEIRPVPARPMAPPDVAQEQDSSGDGLVRGPPPGANPVRALPVRGPVPRQIPRVSDQPDSFHTTSGGRLAIALSRSGTAAGPVALAGTTLNGKVHPDGRSAEFSLRGHARVTEEGAELVILGGRAAPSAIPEGAGYRLRLEQADGGEPLYKLVFAYPGTYEVALDFVAAVEEVEAWKSLRFILGAGAVTPLALAGLAPQTEFGAGTSVVPAPDAEYWRGFVPAGGRVDLVWKETPEVDEGALFFTTSGRIEASLGAGLLRQDHAIDYRVLQGELSTLEIAIAGPGEVLDVTGDKVAGWSLVDKTGVEQRSEQAGGDRAQGAEDASRVLRIELGRAIEDQGLVVVRTQTPLGAFPVRVEAMRLTPVGAVRHFGFIRIANRGSVRLDPTGVAGLTQLAPEQFPGAALQARQIFVYRFPTPDYRLAVAADRIQPEVDVSERLVYRLGESDHSILADIELDIREAPIRETDILVPADHSVVSVQGAGVADYLVGSEVLDADPGAAAGAAPASEGAPAPDPEGDQTAARDATGPRNDPGTAPTGGGPRRNLKVLFEQDLSGRQLLHLHLEKNQEPTPGDWALPRLGFPGAKSVRGDIGVAAAPGFRVAVGTTDLLIEKPLAYFPVPTPHLQQAFRIRDADWSATLTVERLAKSVQADVFHLYSLTEGTAFGSALVNYLVTGAPVSEFALAVPADLDNLVVDGQDVRTWRREGDTLRISLHQPVIGAYTLLLTYEERLGEGQGTLAAGRVAPLEVGGESGYVQVVSPMQVKVEPRLVSDTLLALDAMELPAEFRLLTAAPSLGVWQYTERPFDLALAVGWFEPGTTLSQVVEYAQAQSRLSADGELVTDLLYDVKSRGSRALALRLPEDARLWTVRVDGASVTARRAGPATLIPLPGGADPNQRVAVQLRLGTPAQKAGGRTLVLPVVAAPVLKTRWAVSGESDRVLSVAGGGLAPSVGVLRPAGLAWVAGPGLTALVLIAAVTGGAGFLASRRGFLRFLGLCALLLAVAGSLVTAVSAFRDVPPPAPLIVDLPVSMPEQSLSFAVHSVPRWMTHISGTGILVGLVGIGVLVFGYRAEPAYRGLYGIGGTLLLAIGILLQRYGAAWFFFVLALSLFALLFLPNGRAWLRDTRSLHREKREARRLRRARKSRREQAQYEEATAEGSGVGLEGAGADETGPGAGAHDASSEGPAGQGVGPRPSGPGTGVGSLFLLLGALWALGPDAARAQGGIPEGFAAADAIHQEWEIAHEEGRLSAEGRIRLAGRPGERYLLLRPPAVLTAFEGEGLRIAIQEVPGIGLCYLVAVPPEPGFGTGGEAPSGSGPRQAQAPPAPYEASFAYRLEVPDLALGFALPTGPAAVQEIRASYDQPGWEFASAAAVKIEPLPADEGETHSRAVLLLGPAAGAPARILLAPRTRDLTRETTRFFVEAANLYIPGPGAVDGRHRIQVRPSQGQVASVQIEVPQGLTVSEVRGPVASWQFDAATRNLRIGVEPAQSQAFDIAIDTQGGLDPLPASVRLAPLRVAERTAGPRRQLRRRNRPGRALSTQFPAPRRARGRVPLRRRPPSLVGGRRRRDPADPTPSRGQDHGAPGLRAHPERTCPGLRRGLGGPPVRARRGGAPDGRTPRTSDHRHPAAYPRAATGLRGGSADPRPCRGRGSGGDGQGGPGLPPVAARLEPGLGAGKARSLDHGSGASRGDPARGPDPARVDGELHGRERLDSRPARAVADRRRGGGQDPAGKRGCGQRPGAHQRRRGGEGEPMGTALQAPRRRRRQGADRIRAPRRAHGRDRDPRAGRFSCGAPARLLPGPTRRGAPRAYAGRAAAWVARHRLERRFAGAARPRGPGRPGADSAHPRRRGARPRAAPERPGAAPPGCRCLEAPGDGRQPNHRSVAPRRSAHGARPHPGRHPEKQPHRGAARGAPGVRRCPGDAGRTLQHLRQRRERALGAARRRPAVLRPAGGGRRDGAPAARLHATG